MAEHICPPWLGYLHLSPFRKLFEHPNKMLGPFVREGMCVLEPGCAMGYFTLPLARMLGPTGKVMAVDIQPKMLSVLERRARKAGLLDRIELCLADQKGLGIEKFSNLVDFTAALYVVHELANQEMFFVDVWQALKSGGQLLFVEPKGHVSQGQFEQSVVLAVKAGFRPATLDIKIGGRAGLFVKA